MQSFDWTVGQVLAALDRLELAEHTLVILTSDNRGTLGANGNTELYDLGKTRNVADAHPDRVRQMAALFQRIRGNGRSRP